jgi:hypothetical protein
MAYLMQQTIRPTVRAVVPSRDGARTGTRTGNGVRTGARHGLPDRHRTLEPAQWFVSGLSRAWAWVWTVDHDDVASTVVARTVQFVLLAALFFVTVLGAG